MTCANGYTETYTYTYTYTYNDCDWKDLLTNYNGTAIQYDLSGNPLNWRNASAMTWDGRRLSSMTLTDGTVMSFAYNADGLRTRKTVGDKTVEYVWANGELISEIRDNYTLNFYYENGEVIGFNYKTNSTSSNYYYGKDTLGVIRYLYDANGTVVTTYSYDAWGRSIGCVGTLASTIGAVNPIRYKSYYLDAETGFYYLQSRYYDPVVGRFINADEATYLGASGTVLGYNLFAYCENNAIINIDPDGHFVITTTMLIFAGIGALVLGTVGGIGGYHLSKKWKVPKGKRWKYVLGGVVIGAAVGALIGGAVGYVIGPSASSGIVLWSGNGNASVFQAASSFAKNNGLKVLEKTFKGRVLNFMQSAADKLLGKKIAWKFMKPLWQAASQQFAKTANGVVHVFLNASGINFESTFLTIEYWILRDLGVQMVFHLID